MDYQQYLKQAAGVILEREKKTIAPTGEKPRKTAHDTKMGRKKKIRQPLTQEDYEFLAKFLDNFCRDSAKFFEIVKKQHGETHRITKSAAKVVNEVSWFKHWAKNSCEIDISTEEAHRLYSGIKNFITIGYY